MRRYMMWGAEAPCWFRVVWLSQDGLNLPAQEREGAKKYWILCGFDGRQ
jgi:hypothetical protein